MDEEGKPIESVEVHAFEVNTSGQPGRSLAEQATASDGTFTLALEFSKDAMQVTRGDLVGQLICLHRDYGIGGLRFVGNQRRPITLKLVRPTALEGIVTDLADAPLA